MQDVYPGVGLLGGHEGHVR